MTVKQSVRSPLARRVAIPVGLACVVVMLTLSLLGYHHAEEMQTMSSLRLLKGVNSYLANQHARHPDLAPPASLPGMPGSITHLMDSSATLTPQEPSLIVSNPVPGTHLSLVTEYPLREIQKRVHLTLQFLVAVVGPLSLVLLGMLYVIVSRQIATPLRKLLGNLKDLTEGRPARFESSRQTDELGQVLQAVHTMSKTISARDDALQVQMQALQNELVAGQQREDAITRMTRKLQAATQSAFMGVWDWDPVNHNLEWDAQMYELYGLDPASFKPDLESWMSCILPADIPHIQERVNKALSGEEPYRNVEFRAVLPDGSIRYIVAYGQVLNDENGQALRFVGVNVDMTEQKLAESRVLHMATHDALTGLANRHLLSERLEAALKDARESGHMVAVLYCDLDRFKNINDSHGHSTGDEILKIVASRLLDITRKGDTLARIGGDEFVLAMPRLDSLDTAMEMAQKFIRIISAPFHYSLLEFTITPSVGVCYFPDHGQDAETLLRNADTALYRAKDAGRNTVRIYNQRMSEEAARLLEIGNALHRALERNELRLFYQPKVELPSGRIMGAEALIRWQRPGHGLVPPNIFIPLAEETGLIHSIGAWVLQEACRQNQSWRDQGLLPISIAVNLSAVQFAHHELVDFVRQALTQSRLAPEGLELEVTESVLMQEEDLDVKAILREFKAMGVTLAIDDFGTGYSSLGYLHRYPFDTIKIDRSFIMDIEKDNAQAPIVRSVLGLAQSLNMQTVAEGIENIEQADILREMGCPLAQGYFFSRPVPADTFADLLTEKTLPVIREPGQTGQT